MKMKNGLIMSSYQNASGDTVTLYKNDAGHCATIVCGDITLYGRNGDMMCGARDENAAIELLVEWNRK